MVLHESIACVETIFYLINIDNMHIEIEIEYLISNFMHAKDKEDKARCLKINFREFLSEYLETI